MKKQTDSEHAQGSSINEWFNIQFDAVSHVAIMWFYIFVLYDLGQHVLSSASMLITVSSQHPHICTSQYDVQVEAEKNNDVEHSRAVTAASFPLCFYNTAGRQRCLDKSMLSSLYLLRNSRNARARETNSCRFISSFQASTCKWSLDDLEQEDIKAAEPAPL